MKKILLIVDVPNWAWAHKHKPSKNILKIIH